MGGRGWRTEGAESGRKNTLSIEWRERIPTALAWQVSCPQENGEVQLLEPPSLATVPMRTPAVGVRCPEKSFHHRHAVCIATPGSCACTMIQT